MAEEQPFFTAVGTLMSMANPVIKDTTVTKFKFRFARTNDSEEFACVLENRFGVNNVDRGFPQGTVKANLADFPVYVQFDFGTELEHIVTFKATLKVATFTRTVKKLKKGGVEDTTICTIEGIKNCDDIDGKLSFWIKRKEADPMGKKVAIPMKLSFFHLDSDPVLLTPIEPPESDED